jgi:hypothetical protein
LSKSGWLRRCGISGLLELLGEKLEIRLGRSSGPSIGLLARRFVEATMAGQNPMT